MKKHAELSTASANVYAELNQALLKVEAVLRDLKHRHTVHQQTSADGEPVRGIAWHGFENEWRLARYTETGTGIEYKRLAECTVAERVAAVPFLTYLHTAILQSIAAFNSDVGRAIEEVYRYLEKYGHT